MRVSSITVVMAVAALISGPGLATSGVPAGPGSANLPGADDIFVRAPVSCTDRTTDLRLTSLARSAVARSTRCGSLVSRAGRSPCVNPAASLPLALVDTTATVDDKARLANLKVRRAYLNAFLKAHGVGPSGVLSRVGQVGCLRPSAALSNPAGNLSLSPLASSARAGVAAAAGSNSFLGLGAVFAAVGATAGTVGSVAALASSGSTPASP